MDTYHLEIAGLTRELPILPLPDGRRIASFVMLGDVELVERCADALLKIAPEHDIMMNSEAKGIALIHAMAARSGAKRYVIARKSKKAYMRDPFCVDVQSITTAESQKLYLDENDIPLLRGQRVLIVDDVISTGSSVQAMESLVQQAGGIVAGKIAALAEGDAKNRADIRFLATIPIIEEDEPAPDEKEAIRKGREEIACGEYMRHEDINWE